jgi:pimeloyl-ACP methyl ester carboxylesterase
MVLLHALGERGSDWTSVTQAFAERYRVYAPDLRGHGDTDWPGNYSFQLMRDDVIGLLDHLGPVSRYFRNFTIPPLRVAGIIAEDFPSMEDFHQMSGKSSMI